MSNEHCRHGERNHVSNPCDVELFGELHDGASTLVAKYELLYNVIR